MKKQLGILLGFIGSFAAFSSAAYADNSFSLHLEGGATIPLTNPQRNLYSVGPSLEVKPMFALTPNLSIGPVASAVYLPRSTDNGQNAGTLWQVGGSARLQGDRRTSNTSWTSDVNPWVDVDVAAALTGNLVLPAVDVGVGAEVPLDKNHIAWLGPFVRYSHVFQTSNSEGGVSLNTSDVNMLTVGLSLSFDTPTHPKTKTVTQTVEHVVHEVVTVPATTVVAKVTPVVTTVDLSEKVYFEANSSVLRWESKDKLDRVAQTLTAHPTVAVTIEGNASSDGPLARNLQLATERAKVVHDYLVAHGMVESRLTTVSNGVSHPAASNTTKEGRERNRRVDFEVRVAPVTSQGK